MGAATATRKQLKDYGPIQLPTYLGVAVWQFETARALGLVPGPDVEGRRWSAGVAEQLLPAVPSIIETVGSEPPIGASRSADRLAARTGLDIDRADVEVLVERGVLQVVGHYKDWPLYACSALDALDADLLASVVAERQAWLANSLPAWDAAARLGWHVRDLERVTRERDVAPGRLGRYGLADLDELAADDELVEQVAAEKLLGPDQAAQHLEIRRVDFNYVVAAGWVAPRRYVDVSVGWRTTVQVPLYRTGDLDRLRERPGVDWEEVRAVKPGEPSPLRRFARLPETRAAAVRRFVAMLGDRYDVEVFAWYRSAGTTGWEIDWIPNPAGEPTVAQASALLADDPAASHYSNNLTLATDAGAAIHWARQMLQPGAAVVLDTETTDLYGAIVEIAVIDAANGEILLDTLVDPSIPISDDARMVHGISDSDVAGAPSWPQVLPQLLEVTRGRRILAYNADFDYEVLVADCQRHSVDPGHLAQRQSWGCVMNRRSDWLRIHCRLALGGGHTALSDTRAALEVLHTMTQPADPGR